MATVTLYQPTDMSALPTTPRIEGHWNNFEIDLNLPGGSGPTVLILGSFVIDPGFDVTGGTISHIQIDDGDYGTFPNLDIANLSYPVTRGFFDLTITSGNITDLTAALLAGDDTITGTVGSDRLLGFDGNDTLIGGAGPDVLDGGTGSNTASYTGAATGVVADLDDNSFGTGDARGDTYISIQNLAGSGFDDILYGDHGGNRLSGGAGNDILVGEAGADTLDGGAGSDTAAYDASASGLRADLLTPATNTGDAADDVYVSIENLDGSSFDDILLGDNKANVIGGNLVHDLASGNDRLFGRGGNDQLFGYDGDDTLDGGAGADMLDGGIGINTASYATATSGVLADLDDNEFATGDAKGDTFTSIQNLNGSRFADTLYGDHGDNRLSGGAGNDILVGEAGADTLDGGTGVDTAAYDASGSRLRADLLMPATNTGDAAGDVYISIENLDGSSFDDILFGNNHANVIGGNLIHNTPSGNDQLSGRGGNDSLFGYDGNDTLDGGLGNDRMTGGAGKDVFVFDTSLNATTNVDRITDFTHGTDTIRLAHADFSALAAGALRAVAFYANPTGSAAHDTDDRIVYDRASGSLYYDANGSKSGGATQFATLSAHLSLTAGDFFIV
jgi:Ca2+-binding RTX toxin-like protein